MRRVIFPLVILATLLSQVDRAAGQGSSQEDPILPTRRNAIFFESAILGPPVTDPVGFEALCVCDDQFLGARFSVPTLTRVSVRAVGGHLWALGQTDVQLMFAKIVRLRSRNALPSVDPLDPNNPIDPNTIVAETTFTAGKPSSDIRIPLRVTLEPGFYGLIFGGVGRTGGGMLTNNTDITGRARYFIFSPSGGWRRGGGIVDNLRFFVEGRGFTFESVPSRRWFCPRVTFGFHYQMTSESLFTEVLDFPTGFSRSFNVSVNGSSLGAFDPGDSVDFSAFPGGGVTSFTVTGFDPLVDPEDPRAFPLKLAFSTPTASFNMIAINMREVHIDIKPGSFPNSINPRSKGIIPVAILSTPDFDATTVDPLSVQFGPADAPVADNRGHIEDVDQDGLLDLLLHFRIQETGILCTDTEATLSGKTFDGFPLEGSDSLRTAGCK